jgi:transposase
MKLPEYAVYKGDELLEIGTRRELAKKFNVSIETVQFWSSPANKRRLASRKGGKSQGKLAIRIEDD